jgi:death-on-curing protein
VNTYLTMRDAEQTIRRLGFHVRDAGLLASALARPATTFAGDEVYPALAMKAAVILESVARNRALVDGNERLSWVLTQLFLRLNGKRHSFTTDEAFALVLGVAQGTVGAERAARAIATHLEEW